MSGCHQTVTSENLQSDSTAVTTGTLTYAYEVSALKEVEALIKCVIWNRCSQPGQLLAIKVNRSKSVSDGYEVQLKYDHLGTNSKGELVFGGILQQQQGFEDYKSATTSPLHQNKDSFVLWKY